MEIDLNQDYREQFIRTYQENITRDGAENLLNWMQKTDFFTAPASSKFHCAFSQGLALHSMMVYQVLLEKHFDPAADNPESFAICGLLHDLCKAQFYKVSSRNVKNEQTGAWEKQPYYQVEDSFPRQCLSLPVPMKSTPKAGISARRSIGPSVRDLPVLWRRKRSCCWSRSTGYVSVYPRS